VGGLNVKTRREKPARHRRRAQLRRRGVGNTASILSAAFSTSGAVPPKKK